MTKAKLIIAGPGAGKTTGMVNEIVSSLNDLSPCRYMVVITYTNSAADHIKTKLAKKIQIPNNLFIGTIHSFLNKFIIIPYSSLHNSSIGGDKLFVQCETKDILGKRQSAGTVQHWEKATIQKTIKDGMNKKGYVTYDQTIAIAKDCMTNRSIKKILSNRIQLLFIDEFQDTSNQILSIIEVLRKEKQTRIYCVGDPEQYIQSFSSKNKNFNTIPILKCAKNNQFEVSFNPNNYRSGQNITNFLNNFNARQYGDKTFTQVCKTNYNDEQVVCINNSCDIKSMALSFQKLCDDRLFSNSERCILAKKNDVVKKISEALNHNVIAPKIKLHINPIHEIKSTLLASFDMSQTRFCKKYNTSEFGIIKYSLQICRAIKDNTITNEKSFVKFIKENIDPSFSSYIPIKIDNLRINLLPNAKQDAVIVSNIHNYKGLEADAVLVIAKTLNELKLWLETDFKTRAASRDRETTDYPRLGYVAFSRAKKLLCIGCMEKIDDATIQTMKSFNVNVI